MGVSTSLAAAEFRLREWALQIRDCQNRPEGMSVAKWCKLNGVSKDAYYYRLKCVRAKCLEQTGCEELPEFVEISNEISDPPAAQVSSEATASIRMPNGITIEINDHASEGFLKNLIGAVADVK